MENVPCAIVPIFLLPLLMIAWGLVMIFKKDSAWPIVEQYLSSVKPQRTPEWELGATINGVILVVFGLVILLFLLSKL